MADVKISNLPASTTPLAGTEVLPIVQSGVTKQVSVENLTAGRAITAASAIISDNSANAALRITQVGAGNAILVEDSANPDATPFVVNGNGEVTVGHTAATAYIPGIAPNFQVLGTDNKSSSTALMRYSADAFGCSVLINKSRGAIGAQGIVSSGDSIGTIYFAASDGTNPIAATSISSSVDGTPGTDDMPGRLIFSTTANGASSPTECMRISNAGVISLGAAPGSESLRATRVASAVNYVSVFGAVTGQTPTISPQGSDTNIPIGLSSKGTSALTFYTNAFGNIQFNIANTTSAVNYLQVTGAVTTGSPILSAQGTDADIDIRLTPKGTGVLRFGTYTAGILAQAGYITIKDAAGTTRNLLVG